MILTDHEATLILSALKLLPDPTGEVRDLTTKIRSPDTRPAPNNPYQVKSS